MHKYFSLNNLKLNSHESTDESTGNRGIADDPYGSDRSIYRNEFGGINQ